MLVPHYRLPLVVLPILGVNWLLIAVVDPDGPARAWEYVTLGHLIGSIFAQTSLAAAWVALGPWPLSWRLPLSLLWIFIPLVALACNLGFHGGPDEVLFTMGACVLVQWLLVQAPLWCLAVMFGLSIKHRGAFALAGQPRDLQFGIRQLMILTAIVAVVLGVARLLAAWLRAQQLAWDGDTPIFIFLTVAAVAMTLPLMIAALLPRHAIPATLAVLLVIALGTAGEYPLQRALTGGGGGGPDLWHFVWINAFQAFWVLVIAIAVRLCGYRLAPRGGESPFAAA
jgi:hypothetical protein